MCARKKGIWSTASALVRKEMDKDSPCARSNDTWPSGSDETL